MRIYSGADWIERQGKPMSAHGRKVADILGAVYLGIYHLQREVRRVDWSGEDIVELNLGSELATYDGSELTQLVVMCHDECIRLSIDPNMRYLKLGFHRRQRSGQMWERHPTIEDAIDRARKLAGKGP